MIWFLLLSGVSLSSVAAYYSIVGLMTLFPSNATPIIVMGVALEFSKLILASWLYRNWDTAGIIKKVYSTFALLVLMFITSMGIYGYLSKSHLEHSIPNEKVYSELKIINDKIQFVQSGIETDKAQLAQLSNSINSMIDKSVTFKNAERTLRFRDSQKKEIKQLQQEINNKQNQLQELIVQKAPIEEKIGNLKVEVGAISYIAALFSDNSSDKELEKYVRYVILLIIFVFDPLAIFMVIEANNMLLSKKEEDTRVEDPLPDNTRYDIKPDYEINSFVSPKVSVVEKDDSFNPMPPVEEPKHLRMEISDEVGLSETQSLSITQSEISEPLEPGIYLNNRKL